MFAGCSSGSAVEDGESWNKADQEFVQEMIPLHEQAVVRSERVSTVEFSGETAALAPEIIRAQQSEIELMKGFLSEWGVEFDPDSDPHASHMMGGDESHGMMTDEELAELENSMGSNFEKMWLTMMLAHHQGAIKMAKTAIADGKDARVKTLAEAIISQKKKEIDLIDSLLAKLGS
ncbi:MAG: DUF305 domain-containing protein [Acidimicrobiaceae bacterium]